MLENCIDLNPRLTGSQFRMLGILNSVPSVKKELGPVRHIGKRDTGDFKTKFMNQGLRFHDGTQPWETLRRRSCNIFKTVTHEVFSHSFIYKIFIECILCPKYHFW